MERTGFLLVLMLAGCSSLTDQEIAMFFNDGCANGTVSAVRQVDEIVFSTNGIPDHKWQLCNPNEVGPQSHEAVFPNEPVEADFPFCLSEGPIGWAVNGVAIYNPFAGGNTNAVDGATEETFDYCDGHPSPQDSQYHYHKLPSSCVHQDDLEIEQFIGVARDGFPIYGPYQDDLGRDATNADLDVCHGRSVGGLYRYVFLSTGEENYPYVMGCFRAEPVTGSAESCEACTDGETPCYAVNEVCTCTIRMGQPTTVELLSYDDVTVDGNPTVEQCTDDSASATCRDPFTARRPAPPSSSAALSKVSLLVMGVCGALAVF